MFDSETVYLDRHQCDKFEVKYFDSCTFSVRASELLDSKLSGYDKQHRDLLEPFGNTFITLEHTDRVDSPGWFKIRSVD